MNARTALAAALLAPSLLACAPGAGAGLSQVLPDDRVLINLPTESAAAKALEDEQWSPMYLFTASVTEDVNGLIGGVLGLVRVITLLPPSDVDGDTNHAMWGPHADALDPVETSLHVVYEPDTDEYDWYFTQRPKNDPEAEAVVVVAGEVDAGATADISSGRFVVDFTTIHELDPTEHATGVFASEYDLREDGVSATAAFEAYNDGDEDIDAIYVYDQTHQGEGSMDLAWLDDAFGDGQEEVHFVRSRWLADGQGRSDAALTGGALGDEVAFASECWGDRFNPVYRSVSWGGEEGEVEDCAYAEASYPDPE
ncbi:MAG: hypothetical protein H6740_26105 [Alphaproteobacteria bacterium]|nr:hypothetical protein [Alphaproteobacteria bacterium]